MKFNGSDLYEINYHLYNLKVDVTQKDCHVFLHVFSLQRLSISTVWHVAHKLLAYRTKWRERGREEARRGV